MSSLDKTVLCKSKLGLIRVLFLLVKARIFHDQNPAFTLDVGISTIHSMRYSGLSMRKTTEK
eukprot:scaffold2194_cov105-Skeletonema_marinoi.AAC.8